MTGSADIALLFRVSELARRFGMKPSEADAYLELVTNDDLDTSHFELSFVGGTMAKRDNYDRMTEALGCDSRGILVTPNLSEMEDIVERAMSLAPRARSV